MDEVTELKLASRWKRLAGAMLDGIIILVPLVIILMPLGILEAASNGNEMTIAQQITGSAIGFIVFLLLNGYLLYKKGQTIGKVIVKTKIVDLNGNVPEFNKLIALRYLVFGVTGLIPFVGNVVALANALFIFGKERRCLHDYLAGTRVVDA